MHFLIGFIFSFKASNNYQRQDMNIQSRHHN